LETGETHATRELEHEVSSVHGVYSEPGGSGVRRRTEAQRGQDAWSAGGEGVAAGFGQQVCQHGFLGVDRKAHPMVGVTTHRQHGDGAGPTGGGREFGGG